MDGDFLFGGPGPQCQVPMLNFTGVTGDNTPFSTRDHLADRSTDPLEALVDLGVYETRDLSANEVFFFAERPTLAVR